MKPDHEINGRYFADGTIDFFANNKFLLIIHDEGVTFRCDQSLPLGKCFVELVERFEYGSMVEDWEKEYQIKLDKESKAVVLTELPKKEEYQWQITYDEGYYGKPFIYSEEQQSDDELAEDILSQTFIGKVLTKNGEVYPSLIKAMQEYHRVKSEGLFTKEDLIDFANWVVDDYAHEGLLNQWLESKKK